MDIRISGITNDSIVDGAGIRLSVFTQGCPHECAGCHNPQTHNLTGGSVADTENILVMIEENPLLDGITLSGGEPFLQPVPCLALAKGAHALNLNVWAYTGYTWEELLCIDSPDILSLIKEIDVLVDGRFVQEERTLNLLFRGSKNQRLIDVKSSLWANQIIFWQPESTPI